MIILPIIINIALLIVLLVVVLRNQLTKSKEATVDPQNDSNQLAASRAQDIILDAQKQAQSIITQAQNQSVSLTTEMGGDLKVFEQKWEETVEKNMNQEMQKLLLAHQNFLAGLQQKSVVAQQESENMLRSRINELLFSLEQNLTSFLSESEQKSLESINLELKSARQLIDTYRTEQLSLIDENIVAVLERTMSLVLKEKIDLKTDMDLVYDALEKAKAEKFFA